MNELINSCRFTGRLGRDPEMRYLPTGTALATFSLALNQHRYNSETKGYDKETQWVYLSAFGKLAENIIKLLQKGSLIEVDAQYRSSRYEGEDGKPRYNHNFIVRSMNLLAKGRSNNGDAPAESSGDEHAADEEDDTIHEDDDDFPF